MAKYADHLPLYRQEAIFRRAEVSLPRSTLDACIGMCGLRAQTLADALKAQIRQCAVVHVNEMRRAMLAQFSGKTHPTYLWVYAAGASLLRTVVYDFTETRANQHPQALYRSGDR